MAKTIDMQVMRYINLFERISRVSTTNCFVYNNTIYFAVPKSKVMVAVGKNGENVKQLSDVLRRKIRIVAQPSENMDKVLALKKFIGDVVSPVEFTSLEMNSDGILVLSGEREAKAMLIGRDRSKEKELAEVLEMNFGVKEFKII